MKKHISVQFSTLAFGVLTALATLTAPVAAQGRPDFAYGRSVPIQGQYIIVFKSGVDNPSAQASQLVQAAGGKLGHVYTKALKGFSASLPAAAIEGIRRNPNVEFVEQDQTVSLNATQSPATWGLDRVDQRDLPLNGQYTYNNNGAGVYAFILDTGINSSHTEFTGRMLSGYTDPSFTNPTSTEDCNGHGTHVAGTVGGTTWGVAKGVSLVPVRILNCSGSGSYSGIIAGMDWVVNTGLRPAVINMSLGGGASSSMTTAVSNTTNNGVTVVVAAGNENTDACTKSPASAPSALTVGSTTSTDARSSFSNFGTCVDIFAPGSTITSASYSSTTGTAIYSGTSMASPHVAGAAALVLAANPSATPAAVSNFLTSTASTNRVTSPGTGSPNLLLYTLGDGTPTNPPAANVAVKSLTATAAKKGKSSWRATTTVTIRNYETNAVVGGATVSATYSPGSAVSCVTSATTGSCVLNSANYAMTVPSTVLTVTNVNGTNMVYNSGQNLATQITVNRP